MGMVGRLIPLFPPLAHPAEWQITATVSWEALRRLALRRTRERLELSFEWAGALDRNADRQRPDSTAGKGLPVCLLGVRPEPYGPVRLLAGET